MDFSVIRHRGLLARRELPQKSKFRITRVFGFAFILGTEFLRALAAEQRYEELIHNRTRAPARRSITRREMVLNIFEEFYSWKAADDCAQLRRRQRDTRGALQPAGAHRGS